MVIQTLDHVLATGRGIERSFCCPAHGDAHASASVNVIKGVWVCYACGAHGQVGEKIIPELDQILALLSGGAPPRVYSESWLDIFDADHESDYWVSRVGSAVARENRCGTDPVSGHPTYPIRSREEEVWGVVVRYDKAPKYMYPAGVSATATLFGRRYSASVVVLVEGAADVMALQQSGLPPGWAALGCYGAGLHMPQKQLVVDCSPRVVIAAFDDDEAGRNAMKRAESQLIDVAPVVSHRWGSIGAKDPGEAPPEKRIQALRSTLASTPYARFARGD